MGRKSKSRKLEAAAKSQHPQLFPRGGPEPGQAPVRARPPEDGSPVPASAPRWIQWLVPLLVAVVTLAAFLPALQNQFVNWDDDKNFLDNPHYRGLTGIHLRWMWTTFHIGHYAPLTWMTLGLDYLLWGMNSLGYLIAQGKLAEAIEHYQQAVRIKLDYAEARANLARALALQGKGRQKSRPAAERPHPEAADGVSHAGEGRADKKGGGTKMKTHTRAIVLIAVAALASYVLRPAANLKAAEKSEHLVAQAPAG